MKAIPIRSNKREEIIDIGSEVFNFVKNEKIKKGIVFIFNPHTTAALFINENYDLTVKEDILNHLRKLIPLNSGYEHAEGNSDAHIKSTIIGNSLTLIVEDEKVVLGRWQGIFFAEFDGPRTREIYLKGLKEE